MRFHRGSRSRLLSLHKNWKLLAKEKQMYKLPSMQLFLNLHLNFDFKISPLFLSEYLNLELEWRLNLPLRRNFRHSSKWQLEKCSWINACFLDQKLTSKRCEEVRLLHALKNLIMTIMGLIILKKIETLFLNFKSMFRLRKPENHNNQKNKQNFCPSFH